MSDPLVRPPTAMDAAGCAAAWHDAGRYCADLDPTLQEPDRNGLVEYFRRTLGGTSHGRQTLAADIDGDVVGFVAATLHQPDPDARWQLQRDLTVARLTVDALVVAEAHRRLGIGTVLLSAAEQWGRGRGASVVTLDTDLASPLSVPFHENRKGYARRGVIFRKQLEQAELRGLT